MLIAILNILNSIYNIYKLGELFFTEHILSLGLLGWIFLIIVGIGLLKLKNWARIFTMIILFFYILIIMIAVFLNVINYWEMNILWFYNNLLSSLILLAVFVLLFLFFRLRKVIELFK
jgi:hypothetical protein